MSAIIGRKIGMTQLYSEDGRVVPVTVLEAGPCPVVGKRTADKHGYDALQIAYGDIREKVMSKPRLGQFKKAGQAPKRLLREVPVMEGLEVGGNVTVDRFAVGAKVDVTGISKGRGFAGVVRRHHFSGGDNAHGCKTKKQPGSIGASAYPSRVIKGKRLPGHMGAKQITVKNLKVVGIDLDENLIWVRGAVPGHTNAWVMIKSAPGDAVKGGK
ncbi:MAG TPA: 50S ribosomal protein L3 [Candidatus Eisenbacteria bacterium]